MKSADIPSVRAWSEKVVIPTYPVPPPDLNPMFLEKRVYQGSSGKVYPNPFTDRVSSEKADKEYQAVFLENEYLHLMILPEIGGRIHVGQDKTNGYDFFYRQTVIKPALVGLLGPWISGGVEFNWPQHHRPSTYMPVHWEIEEAPDGSRTVWLSEHESMNRMKGMVGICLHPGKAFVEARVRLYNRTPFTQTFLWWANAGIRVHDQYQAFFPPDVTFVADHAKRAMSSFPIANNSYYGVDYRGADISWYKNIPVPTSYMVTESNYNFFGGYDYKADAGVVHVADRFIAPGKKLWTWGNGEFGYAWDRELTDADGPYIELMAGVYTDNQPDFSWLLPYETKTFSHFWYPIQKIGPAKNANRRIAIHLEEEDGAVRIGASVTEPFPNARILLSDDAGELLNITADIRPGAPFVSSLGHPHRGAQLTLSVYTSGGEQLISWTTQRAKDPERLPETATEPPAPENIETIEELYITGLHLEQYRHATRYPEPYWEEALRRDPLDSRSNTALGILLLRRGLFSKAEKHFRQAIQRLTLRNPNPPTGESHYYLGLSLLYQNRVGEAAAAFRKSAWNYEWRSAACYQLACIHCRSEQWTAALENLNQSLAENTDNLNAKNLGAAIQRRMGKRDAAFTAASAAAAIDPLDFQACYELLLAENGDPAQIRQKFLQLTQADWQLHLDLAFQYSAAGLLAEAAGLLSYAVSDPPSATYPMIFYALSDLATRSGDARLAAMYRGQAAGASPDYCFPSRLEEMRTLEAALEQAPSDAKGHYYLGNLYYDKKRYEDAISQWERSVAIDAGFSIPGFSIPWRNLGVAYFNIRHDAAHALAAYERALSANPQDARLVYELDQLRKRAGFLPMERLAFLKKRADLVDTRDDLTIELITLYNQLGKPDKAIEILLARRFHPWEGGEGLVAGQYVWAHRLLGISCLNKKDFAGALEHFSAARAYPANLGEGKHLLTQEVDLDYYAAVALDQLGRSEMAKTLLNSAAGATPASPWMTFYRALALERLGKTAKAAEVLLEMKQQSNLRREIEPKIDYFATSLPNFLLFDDDLVLRRDIECDLAEALAEVGLGNEAEAIEKFHGVLRRDPNNLAAQMELVRMSQGASGEQKAAAQAPGTK